MIFELILVMCMQPDGKECATFRSQGTQIECITTIRRYANKYGFDPTDPPYVEYAECKNMEVTPDEDK